LDRAGSPSFVELGRYVYRSPHALSQTIDGRYVRWERVVTFVDAIEKHCPGLLTPGDWEYIRALHAQATVIHRARKTKPWKIDGTRILWEQAERDLREPAERAAANRAVGNWQTTDTSRVNRLNAVVQRAQLVALLDELLQERRARLDRLGIAITATSEGLAVEKLIELATAAGETDGDLLVWRAAWSRTQRPFVPPQQREPYGASDCPPGLGPSPKWGPHEEATASAGGSHFRLFMGRGKWVDSEDTVRRRGKHRR
jgi:hypothetical protein